MIPMTSWFVEDMPEEQYHGMHDRLSSTGIKAILRSPAHFRQDRDQGREPTDSFDLGSAAHTLALGTGWEVAEWDGGSWSGKEAQAFKKAAYAEGKIPIKSEDYARVKAMWDRLREHPIAGPWFAKGRGVSELSMFWTDQRTGVPCRGRLDRLTLTDDGRPLVADYKTCTDASPHAIQSSITKFRYYVQQPFYLTGLQEAGLDPDGVAEFKFVFQETKPPYPVTVARLTSTAVWLGQQEIERAIQTYAECMESGEWPEYVSEEIEVDLPKWKYWEQRYDGGSDPF